MALALGGTVSDLQRKMSLREVMMWLAYRKKHGPMSDARRYDRPAALICTMISRATGGTAQIKDFMPYGEEEQELSFDQLAMILAAGAKDGQRR